MKSRTSCPRCHQEQNSFQERNSKGPLRCECSIKQTTIDAMRRSLSSKDPRKHYNVKVDTPEWSEWKHLESLDFASGSNETTKGNMTYFYVTYDGIDFLKRVK